MYFNFILKLFVLLNIVILLVNQSFDNSHNEIVFHIFLIKFKLILYLFNQL